MSEEKVIWSFGEIPSDAEVIDCSVDEPNDEDGLCEVKEISEKESRRYAEWAL